MAQTFLMDELSFANRFIFTCTNQLHDGDQRYEAFGFRPGCMERKAQTICGSELQIAANAKMTSNL